MAARIHFERGNTVIPSDNITGTGTVNRLAKFTAPNVIGDSLIFDNGTSVNNTGAGDITTNTAFGTDALIGNTTGFSNTALGVSALSNNTTGTDNSALGGNALLVNTTGSNNSAVGVGALFNNTTGSFNSAMGYQALQFNTTGGSNSAIGQGALRNNTTGINNSVVGSNALFNNTTGSLNSAMGQNALLGNTTGSNNTALGENAGTFIADGANGNETGIQNVFIGTDTKANADGDTNEIVIGYNAIGNGTNSVVLGNDDIASTELKGEVTISNYTEGALSTTNTGLIQLEPTFKNLSFGESYANLKTEDYLTNGFFVNPTDVGYQYAKLIQQDLLNKSSILLIPQATKESVLGVNRGADLDVVRATTATRVNSDGLIEEVAINVPRIDYTGGGCGKLLLEPQRTNLLTYSEEFDNAYWTKSFSTITPNDETAPDGTMTADKIEGISTSFADATNVVVTSSNAIHVGSIFIKKDNDETRFPELELRDMTGVNFIALQINTKTGETGIRGQSGNVGFFTPILINGYWRVSAYCLNVTNMRFLVRAAVSNTLGGFNVNITGSIYAWGAQLEEGSYPTSYIPTLGAAVTRNADSASKTGISALIGQTEGTIFIEFDPRNGTGERRFFLQLGTGTTTIYVRIESSGTLSAQLLNSGTAYLTSTGVAVPLGNNKFAIAYANNDAVFYLNGTQLASSSSVVVPALSSLYIGSNSSGVSNSGGDVAQALVFKTRLTDAELETLTTL